MTETPETSAMWETIHALWASGSYATLGALHRKCVELYQDKAPTIGAIRRRADRDMWSNDGALAEEISDEAKKTASQILSEVGLSLSRRMEILNEIVTAPLEDHDQIKKIIRDVAANGYITDPKQIAGAVKDLRRLYTDGLQLSLKALKLAGEYAGDLAKGAAGEDGEGDKDLSKMSEEEKQYKIRELIKRMNLYYGDDPAKEKDGISSAA